MIDTLINAVIIMAGLGLFFSIVLAWASRKFKVEPKHEVPKADPKKVKEIMMILPKLNCGRCGYNTCGLYAMHVAAGQCEPDLCVGVDEEGAKKIREIVKG